MADGEITNVADVITRQATIRPWAVAILEESGTIHYKTLDALVWAAAAHLRQAGIRPGDVVGLALPHSALYLVALYGLARIGAICFALPLTDAPPLRDSMARRFGLRAVLATADGAGPPGVPTIVVTVDTIKRAPAAPQPDLRVPGGEAIWSARRTSGTTGEPKAIARSHQATIAGYGLLAGHYPGVGDRALTLLDFSTAFGLSVPERTFYGGGTVVIGGVSLSPSEVLRMIDRHAITRLYVTANFLSALRPVLPQDECRCPGLVDVMLSGMAVPETLRIEMRRRFTPNLTIIYGSNEVSGVTAADRSTQEAFPDTVGRVLPGAELQIVDDADRPLPAGEVGYVRARTAWMPQSYFRSSGRGNSSFRDGWHYLGDLGLLSAEGLLFLKGRVDDMINFDGIKIMPSDIEDALHAHPAVAEAVAFPLASSRHQHVPAAAVILRHAVAGEELVAHCRSRLGVRAPLLIAVETAFPRNPGGKVLRNELAAKLVDKLPPPLR